MNKTIRWNGHELEYDPDNLISLLARVAQITREEEKKELFRKCELNAWVLDDYEDMVVYLEDVKVLTK